MIIELKDTLEENTTYSINFGESIADINEGNILKNFTYAFSTGDQLDSLSISGKAIHTFSGAPAVNMKIQLYKALDDSVPYTTKPNYFTQTDKDGTFKINYLPKGEFKLFGCSDENSTLLFDDPAESICFLDSTINLNSDTVKISLTLDVFNEEKELGYIEELVSDSTGVYTCRFSESQKDIHIYSSLNDTVNFYWNGIEKKSLHFFSLDTGDVVFSRFDSRFPQRENEIDSLRLTSFTKDEISDYGKNCRVEYTGTAAIYKNQKLNFKSSKPIFEDSIQVHIKERDSLIQIIKKIELKNPFEFSVKAILNDETDYKFIILPNSINASGYENNDSLEVKISTHPENHAGELFLEVESNFSHPYLIIKTETGEIIYSGELVEPELTLSSISPGRIEIFLLDDRNGDGKWTTGDYLLKTEPENYIKFSEPIEVRSNWSLSYKWLIN